MRIGTRRAARTAALAVLWGGVAAAGLEAISYRQSEIEAGRNVFESRKCGTCHMVARKGNIRFPLDGVATRLSEADLRRWLTDTSEMERALATQPAVRMSEWMKTNRKITERDVDLLVVYLASLK